MTRFAIDPLTLLHIAEHRLALPDGHQLVAPQSIRSAALGHLLGSVARGELSEKVALERHTRLTEVKIRTLGDRVSRRTAWRIAREHGWSTLHEAEYIAVAQLQADTFVCLDPGLATKASGIVTLAPVEDLLSP